MIDYSEKARKLKQLSQKLEDVDAAMSQVLFIAATDIEDLWAMLKASREELMNRMLEDNHG